MKMIGVDVGGTFTDLIYCNVGTGEVTTHKVPTTSHDPSEGVMIGIRELCALSGVAPSEVNYVLHGTTTATNAVLEHKGARTGMITNEGFRDVIHIARHQRVEHYSIKQELPWQDRPLVKRRHRKTVAGRLVPPTGQELVPLDEAGVREAAVALKAEGVEAVVICFLFSYLNPSHERRAQEIVAAVMPDAFVTTSSAVSPQFREFERFTTAAIAAFVGPKVRSYIDRLDAALKAAGIEGELRVMASNGGVATAGMVAEKPALTLLSGLAAGVLGGGWVGQQLGKDRLITFDVGGTSADIGIIVDGVFAETDARSTTIGGFPLLMPMLDVHTIGAGGGSIAYVDAGGAFRVGPQSAGASPGPAAYGRGGIEPTVTDANLVLGRLDPDDFLGGGMKLDLNAARTAVQRLADVIGLQLHETAEGILMILNANMANAIRSRTVQKGIDPRGFALVAMGGAGPLHGAEVAAMIGVPEVIVPPFPGITSAMGLLTTDLKYDLTRTQFQKSVSIDFERLNQDFQDMETELRARLAADQVHPRDMHFERVGDLRYVGQGYELKISIPGGLITSKHMEGVWDAFHSVHAAEYGHSFEASPVELVNVRVSGIGRMPGLSATGRPRGGTLETAKLRMVDCVFRSGGSLQSFTTPIYRRSDLPIDTPIPGPAIFLQKDSTTVVPPDCVARVHATGSILIRIGSEK